VYKQLQVGGLIEVEAYQENLAMAHLTKSLFLLILGLGCAPSFARESEGSRENPILLNDPWEFARGDGSEGAQVTVGQRKVHWQAVNLPGPFMPWSQRRWHCPRDAARGES